MLDEKQQPVQGASVTIKGGSKGISTRRDGTFSISAADNTTATISVVGYESTQVVLRGSETITITLNQTNAILNDVVVIGYGTQRKKDLTGSIASININETKKYTTSDISQLL